MPMIFKIDHTPKPILRKDSQLTSSPQQWDRTQSTNQTSRNRGASVTEFSKPLSQSDDILPVMRGYGQSKPPENGGHLQTLSVKLVELEDALGGQNELIKEALDVKELMNMHIDFVTMVKSDEFTGVKMFGVPLSESTLYHSSSVLLENKTRILPTVIFESIEYLHSTTPNQDDLFGLKPLASSAKQLMRKLDNLPTDAEIDFSNQHPSDVLAVLHTFLRYLPEPLTGRSFATAIETLCWRHTSELSTPFRIAQILLQMLPPVRFHSMVYILSFLYQAPSRESNQLDYRSISQLFGSALLGCSKHLTAELSTEVLYWLLVNWDAISTGILDNNSGPSLDPRALCDTPTQPLVDKRLKKRRFSRTGADSFPKMTTIEDISVTDSPGSSRDNLDTPTVNAHARTLENGSESNPSLTPRGVDVAKRPFETSLAASRTDLQVPDHKFSNMPALATIFKELEFALEEANLSVAQLEAGNEKQADLLNHARSALSNAQRGAADICSQLRLMDLSHQHQGATESSFESSEIRDIKDIKAELSTARHERDTAIDIIETIKGVLRS